MHNEDNFMCCAITKDLSLALLWAGCVVSHISSAVSLLKWRRAEETPKLNGSLSGKLTISFPYKINIWFKCHRPDKLDIAVAAGR